MLQMKEQKKSPEKELSEMEATNIPDAEFKRMITRMFKDLRGRMDDLSDSLNKEIISMAKDMETIRTRQK